MLGYSASWTNQTSVTVTHGLNTTALLIQVYDAAGNQVTPQDIAITDANNVTLTFSPAFSGTVSILPVAAQSPSGPVPGPGPLTFQSLELKLRNLAARSPTLQADLTWPNTVGAPTFLWFDRQLAQGDLGQRSDGKCAVYVHRVSSGPRVSNMGQPNTPLSQPRIQVDIVSYNAEQARRTGNDFVGFMNSISLAWDGYYQSPATGPSQNPCFLLNERESIMPQLNPPPFVWTQDWRVWNREDFPQ